MNYIAAILLSVVTCIAQAEVVTRNIQYKSGDTMLHGMIAYDNASSSKRPGILVVHEWWGHNDYARSRAIQLAEQGYTALSLDMYGEGKVADHPKKAGEFSAYLAKNLPLAKQRFEAAHEILKQHNTVNASKTAAIGYCFGGGMVLQMARLGVDIDAVVSYHGSLASNLQAEKGKVKAAVRVFNGAADPFVKTEHVSAFKQEMESADVDYKLVNYQGVKHSFTNPGATAAGEKFGLPLEYNASADKDSWTKTLQFFETLFN